MRKFADKHLPAILQFLSAGLVATVVFLFNITNWKIGVDERINKNRCDILFQQLSSKQVDLSYKKSSSRANENVDDAIDYHFRVLKETQQLINEIEEIKTERNKLNC